MCWCGTFSAGVFGRPDCHPCDSTICATGNHVRCRRAAEARTGDLGTRGHSTTLGIYTYTMKRKHGDSADKMAELAGLAPLGKQSGIK
jgi:hypothetical protein